MRMLIATDAWFPQVSGVVRTLSETIKELERRSHRVAVLSPDRFRTVPCPTYPDLRLALAGERKVGRLIERFDPEAIHVATEGPLGLATRRYCVRRNLPFTTSYTTKFPEYLHARCLFPKRITYALLRWFHGPGRGIMVATDTMKRELEEKKFRNLVRWTRGVDTKLFRPRDKGFLKAPRPIHMYVGRVAVEKSVEDFLRLGLPGTKYVVGGGPQLEKLKRKYPEVKFPGPKHGEELAQHYAAADVFVFPSRTDTFGLVMLEALSCGVPVAAYPVTGPIDVIGDSGVGVLNENLGRAIQQALRIPAEKCREYALQYSWQAVTRMFVENLSPFPRLSARGRAGTEGALPPPGLRASAPAGQCCVGSKTS